VNVDGLARLAHRLPGRGRPVFLTCVYGLAAGLAAVAFQKGIDVVFHVGILAFSHLRPGAFVAATLAVTVSTSLVVGWLLSAYAPQAAGSGIPQLKLAFWKDFGVVPLRIVWVKYVAGVLSIGGGCSLGREGPSVQIAGGLAANLAGWLGEAAQNRRLAAAAGAAAGLAAAFNTPLAAVTFVLEEIIADLNSPLLGGVLLASVIGAFVVHGLVGPQPAFSLAVVQAPGWRVYALTPLVAAAAALVGVLFQRSALGLRAAAGRLRAVPAWARPCLGSLAAWGIGCAIFLTTGRLGIFGLGYEDLSDALAHGVGWRLAALLLGAKFLATVACYGMGGCGGIFSPTLFLGGMCGVLLAGAAAAANGGHLRDADQLTLAVVGMSACLGAVVRAPVTGILIVFEMTHEFSLVPALMLGALVSQTISRRFDRHGFYEALLHQDGHHLERVIPPRDLRGWQQLRVSAIANLNPVLAADLSPAGLRRLIEAQPYARFPAAREGALTGVLTRAEAAAAVTTGRAPVLETAVTCLPHETIADIQARIIESSSLMIVLLDQPAGRPIGLVTLHDLLRAQAAMSKTLAGT